MAMVFLVELVDERIKSQERENYLDRCTRSMTLNDIFECNTHLSDKANGLNRFTVFASPAVLW